MSGGSPIDRTGVGGSVGGGDRGEPIHDSDRGYGEHAFPTGAPEHEPGPAERSDASAETPSAPQGAAPDLSAINPGDGPGESPGE